jgi:hypothetical protein
MAHAPGEDAITTAGSLRLHATSSEARIFVGDDCIAEFHPTALRGGWLCTLDGDDYFTLSIDTGANLITLQD